MDKRKAALRRFAASITIFNVLGHTILGFEQSWLQPLACLATAHSLEMLYEWIAARSEGRSPSYRNQGFVGTVDFFLSAQITGLAVSMLLYANDQVLPLVLATSIAMSSKVLFQAEFDGRMRHFLNPSNFGITVVLVLFPWVGISPPYHFTAGLGFYGDLVLPVILIISGSLLNGMLTGRLWLILGWTGGFVLQALLRSAILDASFLGALAPMTGVAFLLFTMYMVTDPATTPSRRGAQVVFGLAVAALYGVLVVNHVVFGVFFALTIVTSARGLMAWTRAMVRIRTPEAAAVLRTMESGNPQ